MVSNNTLRRQPFRSIENTSQPGVTHGGKHRVKTLARKFDPATSTQANGNENNHSLSEKGFRDHPFSPTQNSLYRAKTSTTVFARSHYRVVIYESSHSPLSAARERVSTEGSPVASQSPNDDFLASFKSVVASRYPYGTGYLDIRAAIQEGDPEWKGHLDLDEMELTKSQVGRIRVLIMPRDRSATMDEMGKLLLGRQFHRRDRVFGPGYSHSVLRSYGIFKRKYSGVRGNRAKELDMLFGFTYHLHRNDWWMTHHGRGWGGEKMVSGLAFRWKDLLRHSEKELGLDLQFSYPAIIFMLEEFKAKVENVETYGDPPMKFAFK